MNCVFSVAQNDTLCKGCDSTKNLFPTSNEKECKICSEVITNCSMCSLSQKTKCSVCNENYLVEPINEVTCLPCNQVVTNCQSCNGNCRQCIASFYLTSNNLCNRCSDDIINCMTCGLNGPLNSLLCNECNSGFFLTSDRSGCVACGVSISGCQSCQTVEIAGVKRT